MELHPLASQFSSVADAYERGRPDYSPAVIGAAAAELGLQPGDRVLDLAAGTGKLTRALVGFGFDVTAVEPQDQLRRVLAAKSGAAQVLGGLAEEIPVKDGAVAAVMIADAFHWFDRPRALTEIRRVLTPAGGLALFSTAPDWTGASWAHELGTLVASTRPEHPNFDTRPWHEFVREAEGFAAPWVVRVTTTSPADPLGVLAHMASISWVAGLPEPQRADLLARMRTIVESGITTEQFALHVEIGLSRRQLARSSARVPGLPGLGGLIFGGLRRAGYCDRRTPGLAQLIYLAPELLDQRRVGKELLQELGRELIVRELSFPCPGGPSLDTRVGRLGPCEAELACFGELVGGEQHLRVRSGRGDLLAQRGLAQAIFENRRVLTDGHHQRRDLGAEAPAQFIGLDPGLLDHVVQ